MSIAKNKMGFSLLECISLKETDMKYYESLAGSYAVVRCKEKNPALGFIGEYWLHG